MRLLYYLSKGPAFTLVRKRALASGELLQKPFITFIATSSSSVSSLLSNQLAAGSRPFTLPLPAYRPVDSCQRFSAKRDFVTGKSAGARETSKFESREEQVEKESCKMAPPVKAFERLPKNVIPVHYEITIKPDLVKLVFEGHESVTLKVLYISHN